jgi:transposase InsO family protein
MPWKETNIEMERMKFILALQQEEETMTELCRRFGISRETGYEWKRRFEAEGLHGLENRPCTPHSHPNATEDRLADQIVALRKLHPTWGPKKIKAILEKKAPQESWPAPSTIGAVLARRGLVSPRKLRLRVPPSPTQRKEATAPNVLWTIDHKGAFDLLQGRCYPLTICDNASRYLLKCEALPSTSEADARPIFEAAFREFGLPERIRSDNGTPFASSQSPAGLTQLSVWFIKLGIEIERIDLGHPEQNGAHERMHRTLEEAIRPGQLDIEQQQRAFDCFRRIYNLERPHESLGQRPPSEVYRTSWRPFVEHPPTISYPANMTRRLVSEKGSISWEGKPISITKLLQGEEIGMVESAEDRWDVFFSSVWLCELQRKENTWEQRRERSSVLNR